MPLPGSDDFEEDVDELGKFNDDEDLIDELSGEESDENEDDE